MSLLPSGSDSRLDAGRRDLSGTRGRSARPAGRGQEKRPSGKFKLVIDICPGCCFPSLPWDLIFLRETQGRKQKRARFDRNAPRKGRKGIVQETTQKKLFTGREA
jgi:hypothetical protein